MSLHPPCVNKERSQPWDPGAIDLRVCDQVWAVRIGGPMSIAWQDLACRAGDPDGDPATESDPPAASLETQKSIG